MHNISMSGSGGQGGRHWSRSWKIARRVGGNWTMYCKFLVLFLTNSDEKCVACGFPPAKYVINAAGAIYPLNHYANKTASIKSIRRRHNPTHHIWHSAYSSPPYPPFFPFLPLPLPSSSQSQTQPQPQPLISSPIVPILLLPLRTPRLRPQSPPRLHPDERRHVVWVS